MERKAIQPDKIIIREFRLIKGQIDSPYEFRMSDITSFDFNVDFNTGVNIEENLVRSDFQINVSTVSQANSVEAKGSYHFVFIFFIEDMPEHIVITPEQIVEWNPNLANAIASITYSTTRGILMSRFQGTVMESFILPVIDPNLLLQNLPVSNTQLK